MLKNVFSLMILSTSLLASEQLVLVVADDLNATVGVLQRYEKHRVWEKTGSPIRVTLGRNGLGFAEGKEPLKVEGDGRSPAGVFPIVETFGTEVQPVGKMPYRYADERLICVDDVNDSRYNRIVTVGEEIPKSFERMRREDGLYRYGGVIGYNATGEKGRGSCIFFHLDRPDRRPTAGCTAMQEGALSELLGWLDPEKGPLLLQIPRSECGLYRGRFEGIECDTVVPNP